MIDISKIIWSLLSDTNITNLLWDRIYWGASPNESEPGSYLCINTITENTPSCVQKTNRFELRIYGNNSDVQFIDLKEIDNVLHNHLINQNNFTALWWFKFVPWNYIEWYTENKTKQWLRDFFYYWIL